MGLACSCGKKETPEPAKPIPASKHPSAEETIDFAKTMPGMTAERLAGIAHFSRLGDEYLKQEVKDREELVLPPPPGFKPGPKAHALKLTLIPEKTMIRKGARFRYRVEIQNVGRESKFFFERDYSFIKEGYLLKQFRFYVTPPHGKEESMWLAAIGSDITPLKEHRFPPGMTDAQKETRIENLNNKYGASISLFLTLQPGEILNTRGDSPLPNRFRGLEMNWKLDAPGTYRIKVVFDDFEEMNSEKQSLASGLYKNRDEYIAHLLAEGFYKNRGEYLKDIGRERRENVGRVESNTVVLEIAP